MADDMLWRNQSVPRQGLGLMRLEGQGWGEDDRDPAALVKAAIDGGVTLLDTAELYGNEDLVGRAIAGQRENIALCTKFGVYWGPSGRPADWSIRADPDTVRTAVEGSLRRLGSRPSTSTTCIIAATPLQSKTP